MWLEVLVWGSGFRNSVCDGKARQQPDTPNPQPDPNCLNLHNIAFGFAFFCGLTFYNKYSCAELLHILDIRKLILSY